MANVLIDNTKLTALGNAIRTKTGKSDLMTVSQMATEVANISGGATLEYVTDASGTTAVITGTEVDTDDWSRPSNYPDYSKLDLTGQEAVYFSVDANDRDSAYFHVRFSGTNVVLEKGVLENGVFTSYVTVDTQSGNNKWFSDYVTESDVLDSNGFIVYKASGTITVIYSYSDKVTLNGHQVRSSEAPCVEIYGRLPNLTTFTFRNNPIVQSITLSGLSSLTSIGNAFYNNTFLEKVELTGLSVLTNANAPFYSCNRLRIIDFDGYDASSLTSSPQNMFRDCGRLKKINAILDFSNVTIVDSLFRGTGQFLDYDIVRSYGSPTSFGSTFYNNYEKSSFDITKVESFSNCTNVSSMFQGCFLLKEIDLSDADLSAVTNTSSIFQGCRRLQRVVFPSSLTVIHNNSFAECNSIQEIHFGSTTPPTCASAISWSNIPNTVKIYVPYSADHSILAAYQSATNWSSVTSYLVEEEPDANS